VGCTRCRKLPRALKEWQAYKDLRKTIDDFNATCPLLEMMASKSMQPRHWDRISQITGHVFDVDADNFLLRNLMMAPLLQNSEDIEVAAKRDVMTLLYQIKVKSKVVDLYSASS